MLSCVAACVYALYWSIQLQRCKCVSINLLYFTLLYLTSPIFIKHTPKIDRVRRWIKRSKTPVRVCDSSSDVRRHRTRPLERDILLRSRTCRQRTPHSTRMWSYHASHDRLRDSDTDYSYRIVSLYTHTRWVKNWTVLEVFDLCIWWIERRISKCSALCRA